MASTALTALGISLASFIVLQVLVQMERRRGRRFFGSRVREWCDGMADRVGRWIVKSNEHFVKYIVQLNWYYSIHSVLKAFLQLLVKFYTYFENLFERNRSRTKRLRAEKREIDELNHLKQMAVHKEETALTLDEQKNLRDKKLEERH